MSAVTSVDDAAWFGMHKDRRYRLRPGWIVRRAGSAFLRAPSSTTEADSEGVAEQAWWLTAWPDLAPKPRSTLLRDARKRRNGGSR